MQAQFESNYLYYLIKKYCCQSISFMSDYPLDSQKND